MLGKEKKGHHQNFSMWWQSGEKRNQTKIQSGARKGAGAAQRERGKDNPKKAQSAEQAKNWKSVGRGGWTGVCTELDYQKTRSWGGGTKEKGRNGYGYNQKSSEKRTQKRSKRSQFHGKNDEGKVWEKKKRGGKY